MQTQLSGGLEPTKYHGRAKDARPSNGTAWRGRGQFSMSPYMGMHECESVPPPPSAKRGEEENTPVHVAENIVRVYPNPTNSTLTVMLSRGEDASYQFELWTSVGSLIKRQPLRDGTNNVDVTDLPAGFYTYIIHVNGTRIQSGKQVIME